MIPIIGLCGKAEAGKNHLGNILCNKLGFLPWGYATPLKMMHYAKNREWSLDDYFADKNKPQDLRYQLQQEGTELGRDIYGGDMWVRATEAFIYTVEKYWKDAIVGLVICDVRFPEECEFISNSGGIMLRVIREGAGLHGPNAGHRSEALADTLTVDGVINNSGLPDENTLFQQIYPFVKQLGDF